MDTKKDQQMRISDEEISLLKNTFAENDALLKSMRKAFLHLPMKPDEAEYVASLFKGNEALQKVVQRLFLPTLESDVPLGQQIDLWMTVNVADKLPEIAHLQMKARASLISLLQEGLQSLVAPFESGIITDFNLKGDEEDDYVWLLARNTLITHVEQQLLQIKILAGRKDETVEQTKERLKKDSSK